MNELKVLIIVYENEIKRLVSEYEDFDYDGNPVALQNQQVLNGQIIAYTRIVEDLKALVKEKQPIQTSSDDGHSIVDFIKSFRIAPDQEDLETHNNSVSKKFIDTSGE